MLRLNAPLHSPSISSLPKCRRRCRFQSHQLDCRQGILYWLLGSGAGKSTLLQVLAHELAPQQGNIELNGMDWLALRYAHAHRLSGATDWYFDQTLATNLRLGNADASDEQLCEVLGKVGLKDWARSQPLQLQTPAKNTVKPFRWTS